MEYIFFHGQNIGRDVGNNYSKSIYKMVKTNQISYMICLLDPREAKRYPLDK